MGKCCDSLESGMSTSMNSNGFCLISSGTIMWIMYDGLPSTWLKFIKLHKKSRQSLRRQVQLPDSRIEKTNITCCAPVGVEVDRELRTRSVAYLLTYLLLIFFLPIDWLHAWVPWPKHTQRCKICEGKWCSSFYVKEFDVTVLKNYFFV